MATACRAEIVHPLLSVVTTRSASSSSQLPTPTTLHYRRSVIFPRSKATVLILLWNILVAFTFSLFIIAAVALSLNSDKKLYKNYSRLILYCVCVYGAIGFLQLLFYPIGGVLADLRCGRYRTVLCSMFSLWFTYFGLVVIVSIYLIPHKSAGHTIRKVIIAVATIPVVSSVLGFTGFQANSVQFGLDQLLDAPSEELSVFLHWFVWMDQVGTFLAQILGTGGICNKQMFEILIRSLPFIVLALATGLILLTYFKRSWFHNEPCTHNPYGTVYKVLKYVVQHDKPERRSAMTYADDERPTRMEYPKERFGGPFTTETVEDVKTFLRILLMLVAIGPVFSLYVTNIYVFPLFGMHVGGNAAATNNSCDIQWMLLQSNNLSLLTSIVTLPFYVIFIHPSIQRRFPRILYRLGVGMALMVASVASILVLDVAGHAHFLHHNSATNISCMFTADYRNELLPLDFNLNLLIIPNILTGLAVPFILITTLEFISAQSPHTMKGLLLGVFYAVRGFFIMLGCTLIIPFTQEIWKNYQYSVANCGLYYYLANVVLGTAGLTLFSLLARWYRNREREDQHYGPKYVDDYYSRVLASPVGEKTLERGQRQGKTLPPKGYGTIN